MRRDVITTLYEAHLTQSGGDKNKARSGFYNQFDDLIENQGADLSNVSLSAIFENVVDPERKVDRSKSQNVAEAMSAAGMPNLIGKLLHPVFIKSYTPLTTAPLEMVMQTTSTHKEETIGGLTDHDELDVVREFQSYEESQPAEKRAKITNTKFGKMISLSAEAVLFDQTGEVLIKARKIGEKAGTHLHAFIVQKTADLAVTATGEAADTALTIDGTARAMYADTHASWDDQANDNISASSALSHDGMKAAALLLALMKDQKGTPIMVFPKILLIPESLRVLGTQLMGAAGQFDTGTVTNIQNAPNAFKNAYKIVSSPFLDVSSATTWYVGDPASQMRLQWVWKPRTESRNNASGVAFTNDITAQFKISYFAGIGATDYRYMIRATA